MFWLLLVFFFPEELTILALIQILIGHFASQFFLNFAVLGGFSICPHNCFHIRFQGFPCSCKGGPCPGLSPLPKSVHQPIPRPQTPAHVPIALQAPSTSSKSVLTSKLSFHHYFLSSEFFSHFSAQIISQVNLSGSPSSQVILMKLSDTDFAIFIILHIQRYKSPVVWKHFI